jgi:predicted 3-demethylubiquinone-9 3-methyltransferase (glyoxalase superfamily)
MMTAHRAPNTKEKTMATPIPYLWFDNNAEEAIALYTSIFENSKVIDEARYPEGAPGMPAGGLMNATVELNGQRVILLNGGPAFSFNESFSFFVECEDAAEVDRYWNALLADGGEESQCGWLKDRFGLSWQIIPKALMQYLTDPDPVKSGRVMQAMLQMRKIEVAALDAAYAG